MYPTDLLQDSALSKNSRAAPITSASVIALSNGVSLFAKIRFRAMLNSKKICSILKSHRKTKLYHPKPRRRKKIQHEHLSITIQKIHHYSWRESYSAVTNSMNCKHVSRIPVLSSSRIRPSRESNSIFPTISRAVILRVPTTFPNQFRDCFADGIFRKLLVQPLQVSIRECMVWMDKALYGVKKASGTASFWA